MGAFFWHGDEFMDEMTILYDGRAGMAAEVVATKQRELVSKDYPPASVTPDPPARRKGKLQAEIEVLNPRPLLYFIGSSAPYTLALELGRRDGTLQPRKFLLRSLMESDRQIYEIIVNGADAHRGIQPFAASFAPGFAPG